MATQAAGGLRQPHTPPGIAPAAAARAPGDGYLRLLLALLASAAFFQGYDLSVLALLLSSIQETFDVSEATLGLSRVPIELGLVVAFFVARLADRVGRRPLLLWSVLGYTLSTALTVVSWNLWAFTLFQFGSRVFVGAEFVVAVTMIVEEFPADRRGRALGVLLAWEAAGTIAVALLLAAGLENTTLGWRSFFLIGLVPLVGLALWRRRLRETPRFVAARERRDGSNEPTPGSFFRPWDARYRRNLLLVGLVHLFRAVPVFGATAWWAFFAGASAGSARPRWARRWSSPSWSAQGRTTCAGGRWTASGAAPLPWCISPARSSPPPRCSRYMTDSSPTSPWSGRSGWGWALSRS